MDDKTVSVFDHHKRLEAENKELRRELEAIKLFGLSAAKPDPDKLPILPRRETLTSVATDLAKTLEQLALDIHKVANHCDQTGNKGTGLRSLEREGLPTYFLNEEAALAYQDILFHNRDEDFPGWQCRKKPYWLDVWVQMYGDLPGCAEIALDWGLIKKQREQAAAKAAERRRTVESFAQGRFADYTTDQIALRRVYAGMLSDRLRNGYANRWERKWIHDWEDSLDGYAYHVWRKAADELTSDLEFRASLGDLDAMAALDQGWHRYFTHEQIEAIRQGEDPANVEPKNPLPMVPKVVHVRSSAWSRCPEDERVYIGRNQRGFKDAGWGNPHKVSGENRLAVIELYRQELLADPLRLAKLDKELRGKRVLGCWCKAKGHNYGGKYPDEDLPCHGDVLADLLKLPPEELEKLILAAGGEVD